MQLDPLQNALANTRGPSHFLIIVVKCQDETNASIFSAIMLKNNDISVKQTKYV